MKLGRLMVITHPRAGISVVGARGPERDRPCGVFGTHTRQISSAHDAPKRVILRRWSWVTPWNLTGRAYGHPKFREGTCVVTSRVVWLSEAAGLAQTLNTLYVLRDKAPDDWSDA